ncbi:MAG: GHKL domain-containing protein [Hespellia sp.]|nr:GHKL domain-containing protein [Hespellia sp.]
MVTAIFLVLDFIGITVVALLVFMQKREQNLRFEQMYMYNLENIYQNMKMQVEDAREYRHDLADRIQTLEILLAKKEHGVQMQEYLLEIRNKYQEVGKYRYCTNEIINALLGIREKECRNKNIPLFFQVEDADYSKVEDKDYISIIHNLLDNAIEASERILPGEAREIRFEMKENEQVRIQVTNQYPSSDKIDFKTRKANAKEHGFGMKIIDTTVKKYSGTWKMEVDKEKHSVCNTVCLGRKHCSN